VKGKEMVVLYPGTEIDACLLKNGVISTTDKYGNELKLKKNEVIITMYY
jgi:hypothetical protein